MINYSIKNQNKFLYTFIYLGNNFDSIFLNYIVIY